MEDSYEQANPPSNNEVIKQLSNLSRIQREIFHPHTFDPEGLQQATERVTWWKIWIIL